MNSMVRLMPENAGAADPLDRLTRVAAALFDVPLATVVMTAAEELAFRAGVGLCSTGAPREHSFTLEAIRLGQGEVLVVEDASRDPRFCDNPLVSGECHIRFYAGAVVTTEKGGPVGALCVLDARPRPRPSDSDLEALRSLAVMAGEILDREAEVRAQRDELKMLGLAEAMSGVGHWWCDVSTGAVEWSDEVYRIHGLERGQFDPAYDDAVGFYHPEDQAEVRRQVESVFSTGQEIQFQLRLIRADGVERIVQSRAAAELGEDGRPKAVFGVFQDITEEVQALTKTQRSEARYRLLADNTADVIARVKADGTSRYVSPAIHQMLGWRSTEMSGRSTDYVHPDDWPDVQAVIRAVLAGSERKAITHRALHRDGRTFWVESRFQAVVTPDGSPPDEAIVVIRDASERVALETQLQEALEATRQSEAHYRLLTDRATDIIITYGYDTIVTYVSPSLEVVTGIKPEEMIGTTVNRLLHPEDMPGVNAKLAAFIRDHPDQELTTQKYRAFNKHGDLVYYETRTRIVRDEAGQVLEIQDVARDVTETRLLEQQLREARNKAEAADIAKSEFLANMSHELRTPLTSVVGFAGLLKNSTTLSELDRGHVDRLVTGSEVLLSVINDILDYSKLEAGALSMDAHGFGPESLARTACDLMEAQRSAKSLDMVIEIAPDLPTVLVGDAGRLRQVMLNFLSNAMKFTTHGEVRMSVGGVPIGDDGWRLQVAVSDSGIGIAPDKLDQLFERFTQADQSTTRNYGGTGLGLAICKRLIEAMGGDIGADSKPGLGSTFWFEVALVIGERADEAVMHADATPQVQARVLVADDAAANRELVSAILGHMGLEVETVCDGAEAVEALKRGGHHLVLMDMHMPVMDGLKATRAIRALAGPVAATPIIALTANVQSDQVQTCLAAGMDGHLGKPIDVAELGRVTAHWLAEGRSRHVRRQDETYPPLMA